MLKNILGLSLLVMPMAQAADLSVTLDDVAKIAKGALAAAICLTSAQSTARAANAAIKLKDRVTIKKNKFRNQHPLYSALLATGMSYSISRLAPYAKENLQLRAATLLPNHTVKKEHRFSSFVKGSLAGAVTAVAAWEGVSRTLNAEFDNAKDIGILFNLAYVTYNGAQYTYAKATNTFRN